MVADEDMKHQRKVQKEKPIKSQKTKEKSSPTITKVNTLNDSKIGEGDYVAFAYEGTKFPGVILNIKQGPKFKIKAMEMTEVGTLDKWKWSIKDDVLWYDKNEIVRKINPPLLLNNRGIYSVNMDT